MTFTKEEIEILEAASELLSPDEIEAIREGVIERVMREKVAEEVEALIYKAARR